MKTAIVIDQLISFGGAERVALVLAKIFNADVWTSTYEPDSVYPEYRKLQVFSHPLFSFKLSTKIKMLNFFWQGLIQAEATHFFGKLDLSGYDLVITAAMSAKHIAVNQGNHPCIHYEHGVKEHYRMEWLFKPWTSYMKKIDRKATMKVDKLVCNSQNTRNKIANYYHREAEVVYPPVNITKFRYEKSGDYFLSVQRISPDKQIETQIEAFRLVPEQKLIIIGPTAKSDITYAQRLKNNAPSNVSFGGTATDSELVEFYAHTKAVIQSHPDEDFGIVPVEAMASGKPCLAINSGGFKETIIPGKTGILIDYPLATNFADAVKNFNSMDYNPQDCLEQAQKFSEPTFIQKMRTIVANI